MVTESNKKSFLERIKKIIENLIWTEGTYGERSVDPSVVIRENMDKIKRIQKLIESKIRQEKHQSKQQI